MTLLPWIIGRFSKHVASFVVETSNMTPRFSLWNKLWYCKQFFNWIIVAKHKSILLSPITIVSYLITSNLHYMISLKSFLWYHPFSKVCKYLEISEHEYYLFRRQQNLNKSSTSSTTSQSYIGFTLSSKIITGPSSRQDN